MTISIANPITFHRSGKVAPNRFLKSAMTERLCTWDDENLDERGKPTEAYRRLYEEWGKGEIGVIVLGNLPADRRYPEAKHNACLDPDSPWDAVSAFKPVIAAAKAHGSLVVGQVTHAGRQTSADIAPTPVSSSDVQAPPLGGMKFGKPRPLTIEEINDIVRRFGFAAKTLYDAGADGIQLHSAHGYLLSQFLSPRVNHREDQYGGKSLDNRGRIIFEIIDEVRKQVPDEKFMLSIKINSADFSEGGFDAEDSREMAIRLENAGVDLIELSGGTYESLGFQHRSESTKLREAFFIEFAERIRPHLKTAKLCVTGGFRSLNGMNKALTEGAADIIGLARPLTAEPHLCADLLSGATKAAKPNLAPLQFSTALAISQIHQIANGQPIIDLSSQEAVSKAVESFGAKL